MSEMNKAKRKGSAGKANAGAGDRDVLTVQAKPGESEAKGLAKVGLDPVANASATTRQFAKPIFGELAITGLFEALDDEVRAVKKGDLSSQRAMLATQAFALNSIFTELARRAGANMGEYMGATESYMRLALKAQAQSRATIEALERLANGREQTVKHVHVDNRGGQAVIAENVHTGGQGNGKNSDQSHGAATGLAGVGPALLGADPFGNGVPIASGEGAEAVPDARRDESGRA